MIGRSCIRNPWIFRQIREHQSNLPVFKPTFKDVRQYIEDLYLITGNPEKEDRFRINYLKKFLNFVGISIDQEGQFLHEARRSKNKAELDSICDRYLIDDGKAELYYPEEPLTGLVARPNCEVSNSCTL